jgi:hypothetical protein
MMAKAALDIFPHVLRFSPVSYHLTTAPYSSSFNTTLHQKAKKAEDLTPWSGKYLFFFFKGQPYVVPYKNQAHC